MKFKFVLFALLPLLFFSCSGDSPDKQTCKIKDDCPPGQFCSSEGFCVDSTAVSDSDDTVVLPDGNVVPKDSNEQPDSVVSSKDTDGDGIPDSVEGDGDADGDGIPNYKDTDSDNDGISDKTECPNGVTVDTDKDGTPDYLDTDSDGDGIPDKVEGKTDADGDGIPNYRDLDSDDDSIPDQIEAGADPEHPNDFDKDGIPDYLDTDSDNDTILDIYEGIKDPDKDGIPNFFDDDSDGDGIPDKVEGGGGVEPLDTDKDGTYDFLDLDSDNDGLPDNQEPNCTNLGKNGRIFKDVDGDGFSDMAEIAVGSDPCNPADGVIGHNGIKFYFELPYGGKQKTDVLTFSPTVKKADVFFSVDTTGSMDGEIKNLKNSLSSYIIPQTKNRVSDSAFGVGWFNDPKVGIYQTPTTNASSAQNAVNKLSAYGGGDCPEMGYYGLGNIANKGGWRKGTIPIVLHITDASSKNGGGFDRNSAISALKAKGIKVITVMSSGGCDTTTATNQLNDLSKSTGAVVPSCAGAGRTILKYGISSNGSGLGSAVVNGIDALVKYAKFSLYIQIADDGDAKTIDTSCFIKKVEAKEYVAPPAEPEKSCAPVATPAKFKGSTYNNGFNNFSTGTSSKTKPGAKLKFTVIAQNDTCLPSPDKAVALTANLNVIDNATGSILDTQKVTIIVPPAIKGNEH